MRIKKGFVLRELAGVSLNTSAAYIWEHISNREFDLETIVDYLLDRYDIDRSVALRDARLLLDNWISIGLVEE